MPRYFFNIEGGGYPGADEDGIVLKGPEQARAEVVTLAAELLKDGDRRFWNAPEWRITVTDEQGRRVCSLTVTGEG